MIFHCVSQARFRTKSVVVIVMVLTKELIEIFIRLSALFSSTTTITNTNTMLLALIFHFEFVMIDHPQRWPL